MFPLSKKGLIAKNRKHLIAIATIAFAGATAATAAPVSQEEWAGPAPVASQYSQQPLSRAEVIADANLWRRAGLDKFQMGERSLASDPVYQERFAEYQRLRSGPRVRRRSPPPGRRRERRGQHVRAGHRADDELMPVGISAGSARNPHGDEARPGFPAGLVAW